MSNFWTRVYPPRPFTEIWGEYIGVFAELNMLRAEMGLRVLPLPGDDPDPIRDGDPRPAGAKWPRSGGASVEPGLIETKAGD